MPATAEATNLNLFIPIVKVDEERRLVYGVATAELPDRAGEICDYASTRPYFEKWSAEFEKNTSGKSLGNVRSMHNSVAAGKLTAIDFDDPAKTINVAAKIVDNGEWQKVIEGVYTGFSQGGRYVRRWKDDGDKGLTRYTAEPSEISLVDLPCLPEATFQVIKAGGIVEEHHFITKASDPPLDAATADRGNEEPGASETDVTENEINEKALELARADGKDEITDWHRDKARNILVSKPAKVGGDDGATQNLPAGKAAGPDADEPAQIWDCGCAEHRHLKKGEARQCRRERRIAETAKAMTEPVDAALEELNKRVARALGETIEEGDLDMYWKREFSQAERDKAAEAGHALPDGSYPIKNKQDLRNAIQAFGRAKDPGKVKSHIISRARALGATDMLPADWSGSTKDDSGKAAATAGIAKTLDNAPDFDHPGLHASMVKFHAIEASKCMKAAKTNFGALHKAAAGSHAQAFLAHTANDDDRMAKSDAAWGATMKCYGMGKADALAPFLDPKALAKSLRARASKGVGKGMTTIAQLAFLLDQLYAFCGSVWQEQQAEGDDSPLPGMLDQAVKSLGDVLVAMAQEETGELFTEQDYGSGSSTAMALAALPTYQRDALLKFIDKTAGLKKAAVSLAHAGKGNITLAIEALKAAIAEDAELTKIGARNSAADKARIQSAHDLMKDLGADCKAMANGADKAAAETELVKAQLSDAKATIAVIEGKLTGYGPLLETILAKLTKIEERPLPAKASLRAVDKGAGAGNGNGQFRPDEVFAMLAAMPKHERDHFLMKAALSNPVPVIR